MSNFLTRLAARSIAAVPAVEPRLGSRFEPPLAVERPAPDAAAWEVEKFVEPAVVPKLGSPTPPPTATNPHSAEPLHPSRLRPPSTDEQSPSRRLPETNPPEPRPTARHLTASESTVAPVMPVASISVAAPTAVKGPLFPSPLREADQDLRPYRTTPARTAETRDPPVVDRPPLAGERSSARLPLQPANERPAPPAEPIRGIVVIQPQISLPAASPPAADRSGPRSESPATIHVTIGRIEVRAVAAPAAVPPPRASQRATPSLEQYLHERSRGRK